MPKTALTQPRALQGQLNDWVLRLWVFLAAGGLSLGEFRAGRGDLKAQMGGLVRSH